MIRMAVSPHRQSNPGFQLLTMGVSGAMLLSKAARNQCGHSIAQLFKLGNHILLW